MIKKNWRSYSVKGKSELAQRDLVISGSVPFYVTKNAHRLKLIKYF